LPKSTRSTMINHTMIALGPTLAQRAIPWADNFRRSGLGQGRALSVGCSRPAIVITEGASALAPVQSGYANFGATRPVQVLKDVLPVKKEVLKSLSIPRRGTALGTWHSRTVIWATAGESRLYGGAISKSPGTRLVPRPSACTKFGQPVCLHGEPLELIP